MSSRGRGGLALSAVFPGLPQLMVGRWGVGGLSLIVWIGLSSLLVTQWARFAAGWGANWTMIGTLGTGIAGTWVLERIRGVHLVTKIRPEPSKE